MSFGAFYRKYDSFKRNEKDGLGSASESYTKNILPSDGKVNYCRNILSAKEANYYFGYLSKEIPWEHDEVIIFGKHIQTRRMVAWYGDCSYLYTYSNCTKRAVPWTKDLWNLKEKINKLVGTEFNSCLLNLYHDGNDGIGWHSDDEKSIGKCTPIASLSFGAERRFMFKHKQTKEIISAVLEHGSLLIMKDTTQLNWLHSLPTCKKGIGPRINLTFRIMVR
jgi:alkylated DNA repair dioxygenase AlkB